MKRPVMLVCVLCILSVTIAFAQEPVDKRFLEAQQLEQQGKFEEARDIYDRLYTTTKNDRYFWRLILVYDRLDDYKNMEKLALSRLAIRPGDITSMKYLAQAYYGLGDKKKGRKVIMNIIGDKWNDRGRVSYAAGELQGLNEPDAAVKVYITARKKMENDDIFSIELARIYLRQFKYIQAMKEYLKTLDSIEITYANIERIIEDALSSDISPEDIAQPIVDYLRKKSDSVPAARLLSKLKYRTGDYRGAYEVLIGPAVATQNAQDVWNLAELLYDDGLLEEALHVYEEFYRLFPKITARVKALMKSASIKTETGDREGARQDYLRAVNDNEGTEEAAVATLGILKLSRDEMSEDGFTGALGKFASTSIFRTVALDAYLLLAESYMAIGKPDEAQQALTDARIKARGKKEAYRIAAQSALFHFFTGDHEQMAQEIQACASLDPQGQELNDLLALKMLGLRCSTDEDRAGYSTFARGKYALFRRLYGEAADSLTVAANDTSSVVASAAAGALADIYRENGDMKNALTWYLQAASAAKDTTERVGAMIEAGDFLATELNDTESAKSLYLDAMTSYPGTVYESIIRRKLRLVVEK